MSSNVSAADIPIPFVGVQSEPVALTLRSWLDTLDFDALPENLGATDDVPAAVRGAALLNFFLQREGLYSLEDPGCTLRYYAASDGDTHPAPYQSRDKRDLTSDHDSLRRLD